MKNYAIVLASGAGKRFDSELPKQFVKIKGKTIIEYSIEAFEKSPYIDEIVVVINPDYKELAVDIVKTANYKKVSQIINGGKERKDSSYIGVNAVKDEEANVFIHDCARPFVTQDIIKRCADALDTYDAVAAAIPTTDTIIVVDDNKIKQIPDRNFLMRIQTPQCFRLSLIKKAHELAKDDSNFTDDCGLILKYSNSDIHIVAGSEENVKITYLEDLSRFNY